jgi:hypothetical protein
MVTEKELNWGLSVSPEGEKILFPQVDYIHSDLRLVEDFR